MRKMPTMYWALLLLAGCGKDGSVDPDSGDDACRVMCGASCVDTDSDVRHCGACDRDCTALEGVLAEEVACVEGACVIDGACAPDRADCDGDVESGCEADLTKPETCGACETACSDPTPACTMDEEGRWACSRECMAPTADLCGDACVDVLTSVEHCGACDAGCPAPDNADPTCTDGECDFECEAGFHRCGDACVADDSVQSCGNSCTPCPVPANGAATCDGTSCGFTCDTGYVPSGNTCVPLPTVVTITATDDQAVEGPSDTATFRVARTGLLTSSVTVHLEVHASSTATVETGRPLPVDVVFNAPAAHTGRAVDVVIPAGATDVTFTVRAIVDDHAELDETLRLDIVSDSAYEIGASANATMTIVGGGTNVTRNGDSLTDYGVREGSLRLALQNARNVPNPVVNASTSGPIALVEALPLLDFDVTINGPTSENLVIDGVDVHRIAEVRATVRFDRVTFYRGQSPDHLAGAIFNRGHLTVERCRFANNHASNGGSAIYSFVAGDTAYLVIESSVFENNIGGPAISSYEADITVRNSTFINNPGGNIGGSYTNLGGNTPTNP